MLGELIDQHPESGEYRYDFAQGNAQLGGILEVMGASDEGLAHRVRAMELASELVERDPIDLANLSILGSFQTHVGRAYAAWGRLDEAESLLKKSLAAHRLLIDKFRDSPKHYSEYCHAGDSLVAVVIRSRNDVETC